MTEKYSPELRQKLQSAWVIILPLFKRTKHESHRHDVLARKKKMEAALYTKKKKAYEKKFEAAVNIIF